MRSIAALQTCVTLLVAFFLAPFQHVHPGHGAGDDPDHSTLIHAHFYSLPASHQDSRGPGLTDPDDDHVAVWSVDSFTLVLTAGFAPFVPTRGPEIRLALSEVQQPVAFIEERAHDPPCASRSIPRAPPS